MRWRVRDRREEKETQREGRYERGHRPYHSVLQPGEETSDIKMNVP